MSEKNNKIKIYYNWEQMKKLAVEAYGSPCDSMPEFEEVVAENPESHLRLYIYSYNEIALGDNTEDEYVPNESYFILKYFNKDEEVEIKRSKIDFGNYFTSLHKTEFHICNFDFDYDTKTKEFSMTYEPYWVERCWDAMSSGDIVYVPRKAKSGYEEKEKHMYETYGNLKYLYEFYMEFFEDKQDKLYEPGQPLDLVITDEDEIEFENELYIKEFGPWYDE